MTLGLLLLSAVGAFYVEQSRNQRELGRNLEQVENGRYALNLLGQALAQAGYYGVYYDIDIPAASATLPDGCSTSASALYPGSGANPLALAVQGAADSAVTSTFSCISSANHQTGTDAILVRSVETTATASSALSARQMYIQTAVGVTTPVMGQGNASGTFTLTNPDGSAGEIRRYPVRIFYVSPCLAMVSGSCSSGSDNGSPIPTLRMLELSDTGSSVGFVDQPLVAGVERFVVEYGLDQEGDVTRNNSDGHPDNYVRSPANADEWGRVVSVRITLLSRASQPTHGHVDSKTYVLGAAGNYTPSGSNAVFKHKLFTKTIMLRNVAPRRE